MMKKIINNAMLCIIKENAHRYVSTQSYIESKYYPWAVNTYVNVTIENFKNATKYNYKDKTLEHAIMTTETCIMKSLYDLHVKQERESTTQPWIYRNRTICASLLVVVLMFLIVYFDIIWKAVVAAGIFLMVLEWLFKCSK